MKEESMKEGERKMENESDGLREKLFTQLMRLYRMEAVAAIGEFLEGETATLLFLADAQGEVIPSLISDTLHLTRARVANILSALKAKGLVRVSMGERDRRNTIVELTEMGRLGIEEKRASVEAYFDSLIVRLGGEKIANLTDLIHEIADAMEAVKYELH